MMTWVVTANSHTCRIYHYEKTPSELSLIKEMEHPENKLRSSDLTSDSPGHYKSSGASHGAFSQPTDPKEVKLENFSREIAKALNLGRKNNTYEKLIMIVPAPMYGLLCQHLDKHVKELVINSVQKDTQHLNHHELVDFIKTHTKFPDAP